MPYTSDCPEEFGQIGNCLTAINSNHTEVEFKKDHSKVQEFIGVNAIDVALPSPVTDFVCRKGGHTVITKILIANNGIAAVKEIQSVQKWAHKTFGRDRVIDFFVMAAPEDLKGRLMWITFEWPVVITTMPTSM
ncbi:hypothetical protein PCANC_21065 [Puccinia coronata f. sp. avenae]|uniref:Uncharacterized protein n=1 Tax=Puccinia coronata f. sp. avenae TaxID=200324 RepID=A0A2N5U171_9BASI|nr:hypothetical protein PCASD_17598 [Puccinia coronata f. sp. avenae]PLW31487.1 hypothetical protein PCANC_21065 [Puccinia coronata f. sp. avenae]